MSRLGAFVQSARGGFVESRLGARGGRVPTSIKTLALAADGGNLFAIVVSAIGLSFTRREQRRSTANLEIISDRLADVSNLSNSGGEGVIAVGGDVIWLGSGTSETAARRSVDGITTLWSESPLGVVSGQKNAQTGPGAEGALVFAKSRTAGGGSTLRFYRVSDVAYDSGWGFSSGAATGIGSFCPFGDDWLLLTREGGTRRVNRIEPIYLEESEVWGWWIVWSRVLSGAESVVADVGGVYVQHGSGSSLSRLDLDDGTTELTSDYEWLPTDKWGDFLVAGDQLIVAGNRMSINSEGTEKAVVWCFDPTTLEIVWTLDWPDLPIDLSVTASAVAYDGAHLYVGVTHGISINTPVVALVKVDPSDGSIVASVMS